MDAEPGGVARGERNDRSAGIDHEPDPAAVDTGIDLKVAATIARHHDRARIRAGRRDRRHRLRLKRHRRRRRCRAEMRRVSRTQNGGGDRKTNKSRDGAHEMSL